MSSDHFRYYVFGYQPVGMQYEVKVIDREEDLLKLVKDSNGDYPSFRILRAVWGEALDFEPATFVESYRIKAASHD